LNDLFEQHFGRREDVCASAPGRVNLIGEHTDYNGGFVLPVALPQRTHVRLARRSDRRVRALSLDLDGDTAAASYDLGSERAGRGWLDYVQGVTAVLSRAGHQFSGFDLLVSSEVPIGKGLSSSASLEVSVIRALRLAYTLTLDDVAVAMTAHRAETEFVGAPVGIMDQMACSLAEQREALFLDAASGRYQRVALPSAAALGVIDSGIAHDHATGQYRVRRRECEGAAALLGVGSLREVGLGDLPRVEALPELLNRRARHVITENARVLRAVAAFRANDVSGAGRLFRESHASMRDDFAVSLPDIDRLVVLADQQPAIHGARLTGGGFGGAIVMLGSPDSLGRVTSAIAQQYRELTAREGRVLLP